MAHTLPKVEGVLHRWQDGSIVCQIPPERVGQGFAGPGTQAAYREVVRLAERITELERLRQEDSDIRSAMHASIATLKEERSALLDATLRDHAAAEAAQAKLAELEEDLLACRGANEMLAKKNERLTKAIDGDLRRNASIASAVHALLAEFLPDGAWSATDPIPANLDERLLRLQLSLRYRLEAISRERDHFFGEVVRLRTDLTTEKSCYASASEHCDALKKENRQLWAEELAQEQVREMQPLVERNYGPSLRARIRALETDLAQAIRTGEELARERDQLRDVVNRQEIDMAEDAAEDSDNRARTGALEQEVKDLKAVLARLDALLASDKPPKNFMDASYAGGYIETAWRWFREQFGGAPSVVAAEGAESLISAALEDLDETGATTITDAMRGEPRCEEPAPYGLRTCILAKGHGGPHLDARGNNWSWNTTRE